MSDIVVISGEDVCCSVVFGTLVGVFVFGVMWSELLMTSINTPRLKTLSLTSAATQQTFPQQTPTQSLQQT